MRFFSPVACLALAGLAACDLIATNSQSSAANAGANMAPAAAAALPVGAAPALSAPEAAPDLEGARVLIGQIYMPYTRGQMPSGDNVYTPDLAAAIERQSDDLTGLGYDPFCQCQDFDAFRYTIQSVEPVEGGARARVEIENMGEVSVVQLRLAYRGGRWLVADIGLGPESLLNGGN